MGLQQLKHFARFLDERWLVAQQREHGHFHGCNARGESHDDARLAFEFFLGIRRADESQRDAVDSGGGFDDVGDVLLLRFAVEILHALAGKLLKKFAESCGIEAGAQ